MRYLIVRERCDFTCVLHMTGESAGVGAPGDRVRYLIVRERCDFTCVLHMTGEIAGRRSRR